MKIYKEEVLRSFEFWGGARCNAEQLTSIQMDAVETILEDIYPDGCDETFINDLFWCEFETIAEWLGLALDEAGNLYDPKEEEEEE
jgi:hypothetical protein